MHHHTYSNYYEKNTHVLSVRFITRKLKSLGDEMWFGLDLYKMYLISLYAEFFLTGLYRCYRNLKKKHEKIRIFLYKRPIF